MKAHLFLVQTQQHQTAMKIICSDKSQRQYIFTCNIIHQSQKVTAPLWISSIFHRVTEKSPSLNSIHMCICKCKLCYLATLWNTKLVHDNTVSVVQNCKFFMTASAWKLLSKTCMKLTSAECTVENSWWWAEKMPETCGVL
jgi:hypothetical protein